MTAKPAESVPMATLRLWAETGYTDGDMQTFLTSRIVSMSRELLLYRMQAEIQRGMIDIPTFERKMRRMRFLVIGTLLFLNLLAMLLLKAYG